MYRYVCSHEALANDDPRWAARLATYALKFDVKDETALSIRQQAFDRVARTTISGNERNYMLASIREENGEYDWQQLFANADYEIAKTKDKDYLLNLLKVRFRAEAAGDDTFTVGLNVGDSKRHLQVRNRILFVLQNYAGQTAAELSMSHDTLARIVANKITSSEALAVGEISVKRGDTTATLLAKLIE